MMGATKSPPASWQWDFRSNPDRPWSSSDNARRLPSSDATESLANALECLNIDGSNMGRARPVTSTLVASGASSLASNSRTQSFDGRAPRSISEDTLRGSFMALTPRNLSLQPSSMAELDHSLSPVSLRPHPGPPQTQFHRGGDLHNTVHLGALNMGNQYVHADSSSGRQMPIGIHPGGAINLSAYHSDSSLHVPTLQFGYPQVGSNTPVVNDFVSQLSVPTPLEPPTSVRKRGSGKPKIKNELYKTEICRSYLMNNGYCKYGAKCQFAHGDRERRPVRRHPRYKTKLCRNFVMTGECPYGSRCRFIHAPDVVQDENNTVANYMLSSSQDGRLLPYMDGTSGSSQNLISSSESTESPDATSRQFRDLYGTPVKDTDNIFSFHQELYPNKSNGLSIPSNAEAGSAAGGRSPIRAFTLSGDIETGIGPSDGRNSSPNGGSQSRSRLPVFQTLSGGEGNSTGTIQHQE